MGRQCGEYVKSQFSPENPGVILEIAGGLEQDGAQKRQKGFHEVVEACDYLSIIQVIDTGWSSDVAFSGIQDAFERSDTINCIYSHSDFMMQGVIEGLRVKNKLVPAGQDGHIIIASIDGDSTGLQAIRDGSVDMIAENSPLMHMAVTMNVILAELYGQPYEKEYSLPVNVITAEDASDPNLWGNLEVGAAPYVEQDVFPLPTRG
jgi:ribose transport system substrate-binding protein